MSARSVILGILASVFIATVGYFNYKVAYLVPFGNSYLPVIVFFPLIVTAIAINPVLERFGRRRMRAAELALIAAMTLVAVSVTESGLMSYWSRAVFMPPRLQEANVGYRKVDAVSHIPRFMLANQAVYDRNYSDEAFRGMGLDERIGISGVPWKAWSGPLVFWMPLVVLIFGASIFLALVVHRQWSQNERLPYPIAEFGSSLMETDSGGRLALVRARTFWFGFGIVLALHLINGSNAWMAGKLISIPTAFYGVVNPISDTFTSLKSIWGFGIMNVKFFPAIVAFACFINSDVSFSLGISNLPFALFFVGCTMTGTPFNWNYIDGGLLGWQMAGSFLATGAIILYLGRRYYLLLLGRCFGVVRTGEVRGYEVWSARGVLACTAGAVAMLVAAGLDWPFALVTVLLLLLGYLVFARVTAQSGLFLTQTWWQPMAVLANVLGFKALGLDALAVVGMVSIIFCTDWRQCLMPMVSNGLHMCRTAKLSAPKAGFGATGALLIVLAVGIPVGLWIDHNWGFSQGHGGPTHASGGVLTYLTIAHDTTANEGPGALADSAEMSTLQRILNADPKGKFVIAIVGGFVAVLILSYLRLRFAWWPLHPVLLLVWGTYLTQEVAYSFLLGWVIKKAASRYGIRWGSLRKFMIGVVAGELSAGAIWLIAGAIHYIASGSQPPRYMIYP